MKHIHPIVVRILAAIMPVLICLQGNAQTTYTNPILHADYSDPDAIRVGDDYYLVASSFNHIPGLPILHSKDLVNWTLIGYALQKLAPADRYEKVQHGNGVWAPAIRYHKNRFYIYYPDPDLGIFMISASNINGPWSTPVCIQPGIGLIDPCPFWDQDGKAWLVHAFAGSRAGVKSIIVVNKMNDQGTQLLDEGTLVYDGHDLDPTIEGPKLYKRNGWYYIFAPAGGVATGWQLVLRSRQILGPYERKVVMDQGTSPVNGPHQGAWIQTQSGADWFLHFQDQGAYGRILHLQPMKWHNDWPVIGEDPDGDGKGQPVMTYRKPNISILSAVIPKGASTGRIAAPSGSDEFNGPKPGLEWQWQANPQSNWAYCYQGNLRMYTALIPDSERNYWNLPNLLMQKLPAESFTATTKLTFHPHLDQERAGLIVFGSDYAYISIVKKPDGNYISYSICKDADKANPDNAIDLIKLSRTAASGPPSQSSVFLRVSISPGASCIFSYSEDGIEYRKIPTPFIAKPGRWVGAKIGLFATRMTKTNDAGFADIDWFRFDP